MCEDERKASDCLKWHWGEQGKGEYATWRSHVKKIAPSDAYGGHDANGG